MEKNYSLEEIIKLLQDFHTLTNFRIAIFGKDFHEILAYPARLSDFCKIIRSDSHLNENCKFCDFNGFCRCKKEKHIISYKCHIGLTEMIIPIQVSERILGYLMCGQIFTQDDDFLLWKNMKNRIVSDKIDMGNLLVAYKNQTFFTKNKINASISFLRVLCYYLQNSNIFSVQEDSLAYEIDEYIIKNISQPLNVAMLCEKFHYQKTNFYKITNELYGMGIMKHITNLRIQQAKKLLSTTELNISEISMQVGIDDYNYFTKVFKQQANCTPREYRKNNISLYIKNDN